MRVIPTALALLALTSTSFIAMRSLQGGAARQSLKYPVPMERDLQSVRLLFGLKDREARDWDGQISISGGTLVKLEGWNLAAGESANDSSWTLKSRGGVPQTAREAKREKRAANKAKGAKGDEIVEVASIIEETTTGKAGKAKAKGKGKAAAVVAERGVGVVAEIRREATTKLSVTTMQGNFEFALADLKFGQRATFLDGNAAAELAPVTRQLTNTIAEEDFPACATALDGTVWCAFVAYEHGNPIDTEAVSQNKFDSVVTKGNGDQVRLMKYQNGAWSQPINVTEAKLDVWRPAVAIDGKGLVWVVWSQNLNGDWDILARSFDPRTDKWADIQRVTTEPGADINVVATTSKSGIVWLAWMRWEGTDFAIRAQSLGSKAARRTRNFGGSNEWHPSIAADSKGKVYIAFDTYMAGNYDTYLWVLDENVMGPQGETIPIATSQRFEARPSIAIDKQDRVWIAHEDSEPNWAKDFGSRNEGKSGVPFYLTRNVIVRCLENGKVHRTVGGVKSRLIETRYPPSQQMRLSMPHLAVDDRGRVWLQFRRHPLPSGAGTIWSSYVTCYDGDHWLDEMYVPDSENLLDNRPSLIPQKEGVLVVGSTDGRGGGGGRRTNNNDLFAWLVKFDSEAKTPTLVAVDPADGGKASEPVHPNETEDVQRIRAYRASIGGKSYQLLRGEFHRHTEMSSHRDQDGPFEEIWRYGLDVARMDWIGPGDHMNGAAEYTWWLTQKQCEMYHHPTTFIPMFTYERSQPFPNGHRNVMFARRGIRPLPMTGGTSTETEGSPDIKRLYAYLKFYDGICSSHTSATNMGTDWRDNDPAVEPVVEIFQGHRQSYEEPKAPKAAKGTGDSIGGYQPAGYVWNAFGKGYRLGFQVSSDHVSTHLSYAIVFAEKPTREAILDAFKKRHSYGANDNIVMDVRCGDKMMGDEFTSKSPPRLDINVIGTGPIARIDIVRQVDKEVPQYIKAFEPNAATFKATWEDNAPTAGAVNMYYVRVQQADTKMAWASPMWIRYAP